MDQALLDERTTLYVRFNDVREKQKQLHADQIEIHQRITQIDQIEQEERRNPDRSKDQGVK